MKAKDYVARIVADVGNEDILVQVVMDVVKETTDVALAPKKTLPSIIAAVREGFTKWKAIVNQVKTQHPDHIIDASLFLMVLGLSHTVLYSQAVKHNVFLGYTLSEKEKAVAKQGELELENAHMRDKIARYQRDLKAMGFTR